MSRRSSAATLLLPGFAAPLPVLFAVPPPPAPVPAAPSARDPWSLLDWAAHRTGARYVGVEPDAGGVPVLVRRMLLVHARHALRPFRAHLGCTVEPAAIRFSWRGGRGGLVFGSRCLSEPSLARPDGSVLFAPMGENTIVEAPVLWGRP